MLELSEIVTDSLEESCFVTNLEQLKTSLKGRAGILELLRDRPTITIVEMIAETGLSRNGVKWNIDKLKKERLVRRVGPAKGGHWEVMEGQ